MEREIESAPDGHIARMRRDGQVVYESRAFVEREDAVADLDAYEASL